MTTTIETYQGWKNRETWATALWLNNDEGLTNWVQDMTIVTLQGSEELSDKRYLLAESIEEYVTNLLDFREYRETYGEPMPDGLQMMRDDIGSLYRVDWREIADSFLEGVSE
jgi:hypothetical protein